jgi:hypothetical protein
LLWAPWLGLWAALRGERRLAGMATRLVRFSAGVGAVAAPWIALGALMPHLPTTPLAGQAGFFRYWIRADWKPATWNTWAQTRWMNFANTFIPLHLVLSDSSFHHPKLSSAYEVSGRWVRYSQLWWNTLPFALGLGLWAISLTAIGKALRSVMAATVLFIFAPALFITGYWGMDPLGLMRECGHPLFVAIIMLTCVVAARHGGRLSSILRHPLVPWLQLPETWLMLWLTTLLNRVPSAGEFTHLNPLAAVINVGALGVAAWLLSQGRVNLAAGASSQSFLGTTNS